MKDVKRKSPDYRKLLLDCRSLLILIYNGVDVDQKQALSMIRRIMKAQKVLNEKVD